MLSCPHVFCAHNCVCVFQQHCCQLIEEKNLLLCTCYIINKGGAEFTMLDTVYLEMSSISEVKGKWNIMKLFVNRRFLHKSTVFEFLNISCGVFKYDAFYIKII
jgi:hypothetical protein